MLMELNTIVGWIAAISGTAAALMVSLNFGQRITGYGFVIFTVSSVAWILTGWLDGEFALLTQNAVLLGINCLGIYRWLIRPARRATLEGGAKAGGGEKRHTDGDGAGDP